MRLGALSPGLPTRTQPLRFSATPPESAEPDTPIHAYVRTQLIANPLLEEALKLAQQQHDTTTLYTTGKPPVFRVERQAMHKRIIDESFDAFYTRIKSLTPLNPKQAHIVTGLPASGKSTQIIYRLQTQYPQAYVLDMDVLSSQLPEYQIPLQSHPHLQRAYTLRSHNGIGAAAVHREGQHIAKQVLERLINENRSFMMSYVGQNVDAEVTMIRRLHSLGYQVTLHHVTVAPQTAVDRVIQRFKNTGRLVSPWFIAQLGDSPLAAFHETVRQTRMDSALHASTIQNG